MTDELNDDERWFAHLLASVPTPASLGGTGTVVPARHPRREGRSAGRLGLVVPLLVAVAVISAGVGLTLPQLHGGRQLTPATAGSPPARSEAALAGDDVHQLVVLFGGRDGDGGLLGDTWLWDGGHWTEQHPAHSPSARRAAAMSSDPDDGGVLLLGGVGSSGQPVGDSWTWNGSDWQLLPAAGAPTPRTNAAMAWDPIAGALVLYGSQGDTTEPTGTTWVRKERAWQRRHDDVAPSACTSPMAYDDATRALVLVSGRSCGAGAGLTWSWAGTLWAQEHPAASPPAADRGVLAYDQSSQQLVLFVPPPGSGGPCGLTWTWDGAAWSPRGPSLPASAGMAVADPASRRPLLLTATGETWSWDGATWQPLQGGTSRAAEGAAAQTKACAGVHR
jgi:hypothetical protein